MAAEVTKRHRELAVKAMIPGCPVSSLEQLWIDGKRPLRWPEGDANRYAHFQQMAQSLADIEAEALASKPQIFEAHGVYVSGPPGDAKGSGCLLCDMIETVGPHAPDCVTRASAVEPGEEELDDGWQAFRDKWEDSEIQYDSGDKQIFAAGWHARRAKR